MFSPNDEYKTQLLFREQLIRNTTLHQDCLQRELTQERVKLISEEDVQLSDVNTYACIRII